MIGWLQAIVVAELEARQFNWYNMAWLIWRDVIKGLGPVRNGEICDLLAWGLSDTVKQKACFQ